MIKLIDKYCFCIVNSFLSSKTSMSFSNLDDIRDFLTFLQYYRPDLRWNTGDKPSHFSYFFEDPEDVVGHKIVYTRKVLYMFTDELYSYYIHSFNMPIDNTTFDSVAAMFYKLERWPVRHD